MAMNDQHDIFMPFKGLVAASDFAAEIASPPYDVVNREEAKEVAAGNPNSFLRVSRAEIEFPDKVKPTDKDVYKRAEINFRKLIDSGFLISDSIPSYYVLKLQVGKHSQIGLVSAASLSAYNSGSIKRHEFTRPDKENDRVDHMKALSAATGPTLLVHRPVSELADYFKGITNRHPIIDIERPDGVRHTLWRVSDKESINEIRIHLKSVDVSYIADGHHRTAAANRVAEEFNIMDGRFLSVMFPSDQLMILDYNRVVRDLGQYTKDQFLNKLNTDFSVVPLTKPQKPKKNKNFSLYIGGQWYNMELKPTYKSVGDFSQNLDVSLLTNLVLKPVLDIQDLRTDPRIDFVGGARGLEGLEKFLDVNNWSAAFSLFPTSIDSLMRVADNGSVMPPKSTWFEPKLLDGLVSLFLDI